MTEKKYTFKLLKPGRRNTIYYQALNNFSTSEALRASLHKDCGLKPHEKFVQLKRSDGVIFIVPGRIYKAEDYGIDETKI